MKAILFRSISILVTLALLLVNVPTPQSLNALNNLAPKVNTISDPSLAGPLDRAHVSTAPLNSPVMFVENVGQFAGGARFQVRSGDRTLWLAEDALWVTLLKCPQVSVSSHQTPIASWHSGASNKSEPCAGVNIRLSFVDSNPHPSLEPFNRLDTHISYFVGDDPAKWHANVPVWGGVRYKDLYPDTDLEITSESWRLVFRASSRIANSLFTGRAPNVRLRVKGADGLMLEDDALCLTTPVGEYALPLLQAAGISTATLAHPVLADEQVLSPFAFSSFRPQSARRIQSLQSPDLLYSTFLGGISYDYSHAMAVDGTGNAYVTGETASLDFPTTPGAFDTINNSDAFVVKVNVAGAKLEYATFLGGNNGAEKGYGIAVDETGQAFIAGDTTSNDFPATPGAYDTTYNNNGDVFVAKVNATGTGLDYATYLGGSGGESAWGKPIAVDGAGNAYVTGETCSSDFPHTWGTYTNGYDAFVARLDAAGANLVYGTFLGGANYDAGFAIAVDKAGNAYVTGQTNSNDFPVTPGAYDTNYDDNEDVFVTKINVAGTALAYSTFLNGSSGMSEEGYAIAADGPGSAYVTGYTCSPTFPTTPGAFDTSFGGSCDAFVTQMNTEGTGLVYSAFLGGGNDEMGYGIAVDGSGNAYVTGETWSDNFPITLNAFDTSYNGGADAFVVKVNADGANLAYATYLGAGDDETGAAIAVDGMGNAYVTGQTYSAGFPATAGAFDTFYSGVGDAFITKLMAGIHIEINQAIGQQYPYSRKFVAGKKTAIRVLLPAPLAVNVAAQQVVVKRDGVPVTTLYPLPSPWPTNTLTFLCSTLANCGNWEAGDYAFDATIDGITAQSSAAFRDRKTLHLLAVPIKIRKGNDVIQLPDDQWKSAVGFLRSVYPIAYSGGVEWAVDKAGMEYTWGNGNNSALLLTWLWLKYRVLCGAPFRPSCYDAVIGFAGPVPVPFPDKCHNNACTHVLGGSGIDFLEKTAWLVANSSFADPDCPEQPFFEMKSMQATVAHEVGHLHGLGDEYNHPSALYKCEVNPPPSAYGGHEPGKGVDCLNPYHCGQSAEVPWSHDPITQTGSMIISERDHPFEVGDRGPLGDMLSLMGSNGGPQEVYWITPRVYDHLFDQFVPSGPSQVAGVLAEPVNIVAVSGDIGQDGSVRLDPWYHIALTVTPGISFTAKDYTVEAVDTVSQTLARQGLDVIFCLPNDPTNCFDRAPFGAVITFPPGTAAFRIKHGEQVLKVVPVSPHAPTVAITAPTAGQVVSGSYTIAWQSSDADGDPLYHRLEYTPDGQNWHALATNITQTQTVVNFDNLPGGQQFRIRILATDGVNTTEAISPPFVVPPKPPEVFIESSKPGAQYMFGMNVPLSGWANDDQDGNIFSDASLLWNSSQDGLLTRGPDLNIHTLSVGTHTITLSATNSLGLTGSASVTITVKAWEKVYLPIVLKNYPPLAPFATIVLDAPQPDGDHGWYISDVQVSFAVPPGTSLPPIEYRLNMSNWQTFTAPFTITTEGGNLVQIRPAEVVQGPFGMQAFQVRSASVTGEEILSFIVQIDKSPPTLAITAPQSITYTHGTTFTLDYQAADACSGLAAITATLDFQPAANGQVIDTLALGYGTHTFALAARDMAGHTAEQTVVFTVTATIPGLIDLKHRLYAEGSIYGPGAAGIVQSLDAKLEAAQRNLAAGQLQAAINTLQAFIHEVAAQTGKHITSDAAQLLTEDAQRIIAALSDG